MQKILLGVHLPAVSYEAVSTEVYAAAAQCLLSKASSGRLVLLSGFEEKPTHCFAVAGTVGMVAAATFT